MTSTYIRVLTSTAAVGAGLSAGVYFAFSTLVMGGIHRLAPPQAISAMNAVNKAAPASPLLMLVLFGNGVGCVLLMISAFRHRGDPATAWQVAGAVLFLVGMFITLLYHVPHNDRLMKFDPDTAGAAATAATWKHFYGPWMLWNHARTLASFAGTICLVLALHGGRSGQPANDAPPSRTVAGSAYGSATTGHG